MLALGVALVLHLGALFFLQGMKITGAGSAKKSLMENRLALGSSGETLEKAQQQLRLRNRQLARAFKELKIDKHESTEREKEQTEYLESYSDIDLDAIPNIKGTLPSPDRGLAFSGEPPPSLQCGEQLIFPEEQRSAKELIAAAEATEGLLIPDPSLSPLTDAPRIKVGNAEGSKGEGSDSENRSGLLEEGLREKGLEHLSGLIASEGGGEGGVASSDDFVVQVEYAPAPEGEGYLFRATLAPKQSVSFKRIKQNLFFLIDRSHSIAEGRFQATKEAVGRALAAMHPEDSFNILLFDKNVSRLSETNLPCTPENIRRARKFLKKEPYGGLFATTDLYVSLGSIVPKEVAENEVNTAILLSDGDSYLKPGKQRAMIRKWTEQNGGKVALYCIASERGDNLTLLDLISSLNRGALHLSPGSRALPGTVGKLLGALRNPIGKEIAVTAVPIDKDPHVQLFPPKNRLPHLYSETPYILYGATERLDDFYLFIQGRHYDKWLEIKRRVTFGKAKKSDPSLLKKLVDRQSAYSEYEREL